MLVTPEQAKKWLTENTGKKNRKISQYHVSGLARDMVNGSWMQTADPIKFDTDNDLIDGQHRLTAVVLADIPVELAIAEGLDPKAMLYVDTGRKRGTGDILNMAGFTDGKTIIAVKRLEIDVLNAQDKGALPSGRATNAELIEMAEKDEHIQWVVNSIRDKVPFRFLNRTVACYSYLMMHRIDAFAAAEFFERLITPNNIDDRSPIMILHKRLAFGDWTKHGGKAGRLELVSLINLAWNAWRKDEKRTILKAPRKQDGTLNIPELI